MKNCIFIALALLASCASDNRLPGTYVRKAKNREVSLVINRDSTFNLVTYSGDVRSGCDGSWDVTGDTLWLRCKPAHALRKPASATPPLEDETVIVLSEKRLKLGIETLRRKK